jgi:uncharacterized protein|eukprot:g3485.t1
MLNGQVAKILGSLSALGSAAYILYNETREGTFKIQDLVLTMVKATQSKRIRSVFLGSLLVTYGVNKFTNIQSKLVSRFAQILASFWTMYYLLYYGESPVLKYKKTLFNRQIVQKAGLTETFWPCVWLTQADAMTVLGSFFSDLEFLLFYDMEWKKTKLLSYDGVNDVCMDWYIPQQKGKVLETKDSADPVVVLVHGLGGSTDANYLKKFARAAHSNGWRAVSYDWWRLDFAEWRDLDIGINHIAHENPEAPIVLVCFSAGTHVGLRYLQESGKDSPLVAAVAVSPVQDLIEEYSKIRDVPGRQFIYKDFVNRTTKGMARRSLENDKRDDFKEDYMAAIEEETETDNLYDRCIFNSVTYSCKNHPGVNVTQTSLRGKERPKFLGTEDHYAGAVAGKWDRIKVTTLLLHAHDDPVLAYSSIEWDDVVSNKNLIAMSTAKGGHVAWHEGIFPFGETWSHRQCLKFLASVLDTHATTNFMLQVMKSAKEVYLNDDPKNYKKIPSVARIARIVSSTDLEVMRLQDENRGGKGGLGLITE